MGANPWAVSPSLHGLKWCCAWVWVPLLPLQVDHGLLDLHHLGDVYFDMVLALPQLLKNHVHPG